MPQDSRPSDPVFISVSLWEFTGNYQNDCIAKAFNEFGPGNTFGGPIDAAGDGDLVNLDFSDLAGGFKVDKPGIGTGDFQSKGCATQFLIAKQVSASVTCP